MTVTQPVVRPATERYAPHLGCAARAERRGDSMVASAPPAQRWLLVEYRGAWPRVAADVLGDVAPRLTALCRERNCRPVLIRRHGRYDRTAPRRWGLVDSRPGRESVRWGQLSADEHLLDVLTAEDPGVPGIDPVYLVCAHGRHDACCAVRGRPVAAALAAEFPDRTWECSHVGGDRFAANVIVLPHGLTYGHVSSESVVDVVRRFDEGYVVPELLRGRSAFAAAVQAAQHFARTAGGSEHVDALRPRRLQHDTDDTSTVELDGFTVTVRTRMRKVDGAMTCASRPPGQMRVFDLVSLEPR